MNEQSFNLPNDPLEIRLEKVAGYLVYPPTPDIVGSVKQQLIAKPGYVTASKRRLAWAAVMVLFILAGLLAVPQVRAAYSLVGLQ